MEYAGALELHRGEEDVADGAAGGAQLVSTGETVSPNS